MELSATFKDIETFIGGLQDQICNGLEVFEPILRFHQDIWEREQGGGGWTRILSGGQTFGKAGVNISSIHGEMTKELACRLIGPVGRAAIEAQKRARSITNVLID